MLQLEWQYVAYVKKNCQQIKRATKPPLKMSQKDASFGVESSLVIFADLFVVLHGKQTYRKDPMLLLCVF